MAKTVAELSEIVADLKARLEKLEKLNNGSNEFTNHLRFVEAFRTWMKYDDAWVEAWFDRGEVLQKEEKRFSPGPDDMGGSIGGP